MTDKPDPLAGTANDYAEGVVSEKAIQDVKKDAIEAIKNAKSFYLQTSDERLEVKHSQVIFGEGHFGLNVNFIKMYDWGEFWSNAPLPYYRDGVDDGMPNEVYLGPRDEIAYHADAVSWNNAVKYVRADTSKALEQQSALSENVNGFTQEQEHKADFEQQPHEIASPKDDIKSWNGYGEQPQTVCVDELAQEIRRVDGNHDLGAGSLAEALMPFLISQGYLQSGVPEGFVVVPIEPTWEMQRAAVDCITGIEAAEEITMDDFSTDEAALAYEAMIEAAPKPPTQDEERNNDKLT